MMAEPPTRGAHPGAWWLWALALAAAASHTTNPVLLGLIIAVAGTVVAMRRSSAPWAVAFRWYLLLAAGVVVIRVVFRALTAGAGPTVLVTLPGWDLPGDITLLGPVSAEALVAGAYDGLRLGTLLVCVGAANALADPKRLLAAVPSALYELGTVLVVSTTVFPQLAESVGRVRRAQSLRGGPVSRRRRIRPVLLAVLTDALDRSLLLAASMDSRGYGRVVEVGSIARRRTTTALLASVLGIAVGTYGLLGSDTPWYLGLPVLAVGLIAGVIGFRLAGSRVRRTRFRAEKWAAAEWVIVCSALAAAVLTVTGDLAELYPSASPLVWPTLPLIPALGLLLATAPAWSAQPVAVPA